MPVPGLCPYASTWIQSPKRTDGAGNTHWDFIEILIIPLFLFITFSKYQFFFILLSDNFCFS
ncbi:hypothetical protein HK26_05810 [Acetobacter okinawensis]|uniref:Uncharacterized protein n=1 Tax=Acetobacter okinawensis TaxID=1076594 RepID=A0A252BST6_9PROT|nr:hypothetical protein HK26_05810 [Acetobacter okinawensis]